MIAASGLDLVGGPVLYGFSLGLVAAVNPCGFPLLPAYLMLSARQAGSSPFVVRAGRALLAGAAMTVGFVLVFGPLGWAAKLGVDDAASWVPWVMVPLGLVCVAAGLATTAGRPLPLRLPVPTAPAGRGRAATFVVFGAAFAVASLTCALPLFVVGVADSFSRHGAAVGLASGLAYALGMGLVVTAVSLAGAGSRHVRLRRLRAAHVVVERAAGVVLTLVGAYLLLYWIADLVDPLGSPAPVRAVEWVQAHVANGLSASPRVAGAAIGGLVVAVLAAAAVHAARDQSTRAHAAGGAGQTVGERHAEQPARLPGPSRTVPDGALPVSPHR